MKIGYVQTNPLFGEKDTNFEQVNGLLEGMKADLLVLPELFATGYAFISKTEVESLAEEIDGPTFQFLKKQSQKTEAVLIGGFAERDGDKIYNSAMIVSKNKLIGVYRKIHLYYKEKEWFSPGNKTPEVFNVKGVNIGVMICFDWFFPETIRTLALQGSEIIAHPSNLVLPYCQKAMQTRCLVNRVYAITSNRIGREKRGNDDFIFTGGSQITSYNGEILSSSQNNDINVAFVEIDIEKARDKHLNPYNNIFEDRRPEFYKL
ncbi:MAG: acyltransferase [Candidatus Lokiarchaeota archaeon]|nr:acyltransferase [Candidatus Lokiarchaeota archaeon]